MPTEILMPALSPTMEEGTLAKWHVREGDAVQTGDVIAEIETDKATMEVEAIDDGTMGQLLVPEGTEHIPVNKPIAFLLTDGEDAGEGSHAPIESGTPSPPPSPQRGEGVKDAPYWDEQDEATRSRRRISARPSPRSRKLRPDRRPHPRSRSRKPRFRPARRWSP
jgi:pyruvate/2-oxoglutarate dehydrogenase complex dihydrolipoamide acyltransferase (E2) component